MVGEGMWAPAAGNSGTTHTSTAKGLPHRWFNILVLLWPSVAELHSTRPGGFSIWVFAVGRAPGWPRQGMRLLGMACFWHAALCTRLMLQQL